MRISNAIRWVVFGVGALTLSPVIGGFFVELARQRGLYDDPEATVNVLLSGIVEIASYWWYPWVAGGTVGLIVGVWLDWFARKRDARQREQRRTLAIKLTSASRTLGIMEQNADQNKLTAMPLVEQYVDQIRSLEFSLIKLGIPAPQVDFEVDPIGFIQRMRSYTSRIAPLIEDGHLSEAKREGHKLSERIRSETKSARITTEDRGSVMLPYTEA